MTGGGRYVCACHLMKVMRCLLEEDAIKSPVRVSLICKEAKIRH